MIRKNKDILIFQALNWIGSYFLYVSFLKAVSPEIFSKIAAGEVFFGAFGAFLMTWSLRRFDESPSFGSEINGLSFRLLVLGTVAILFALFGLDFTYMAAIVPILLTPAHLPLKLGFTKHAYLLISLKLIFVPLISLIDTSKLSSIDMALIYFAPTIIYGIGIYVVYLPKFRDISHLPKPHKTKQKIKQIPLLLSHITVTILSSLASATAITKVVESGWIVAAIERLARSGYSFLYPHLIRKGVIGGSFSKFADGIIIGIVALLYFYTGEYAFVILMPLPVLIDIFMTNGAGRHYKSDIFMIIIFLALIGVLNG